MVALDCVCRRLGDKLGRLDDNKILTFMRQDVWAKDVWDVWENNVGRLGDKWTQLRRSDLVVT